jgi:hypothetical protein
MWCTFGQLRCGKVSSDSRISGLFSPYRLQILRKEEHLSLGWKILSRGISSPVDCPPMKILQDSMFENPDSRPKGKIWYFRRCARRVYTSGWIHVAELTDSHQRSRQSCDSCLPLMWVRYGGTSPHAVKVAVGFMRRGSVPGLASLDSWIRYKQ